VITDITERVRTGHLLEQRVDERTHELSTLLELSHEITSTEGLDYQLNQILARLKTIVDFNNAAIVVSEEKSWSVKACWPTTSLEQVEDLYLTAEDVHTLAQMFEPGESILLHHSNGVEAQLNGLQKMQAWLEPVFPMGTSSWLGIPIIRKDCLIGIFILGCDDENGFSDDQVKIAEGFTNQTAIVIENNQLFEQARANVAAGERNRLAQELHDSVTQTLFSASVLAQATPRIWAKDQGIARQNMEKINTLIRGALAEMRSLLLELRSGDMENQTLSQLLTTLVEAGRVRTRATITTSVSGDGALPEKVKLFLYRIAQETLNNAINHAEATLIEITLLINPDHVEFRIQDDGCGFNLQDISTGHLGINIMSERARQIGADLQIHSVPGRGTIITVTWPTEGETQAYE
jgi:two-component system nitrate/nitrite sensor histidine kinase NarX